MIIGWLLAHGVGSRGTLPLPLWQFSWAAIAALVLSFVALGALWQSPKLSSTVAGRAIPGSRGPLLVGTWVFRILGLVLFGLTIGAALFGADVAGESTNLAPVTLYVMVWVAVPVASAFFGDVWRSLNPYRTIGLLFPADGPRRPPKHQWVAVATMVGFLFLELAHPSGDSPRILGWAMVVYSVVMIGGMARFGRAWLDRADGFGILFSMIAGMSPFRTDDSGDLLVRLPLAGLSDIEVRRGTTTLILVVLGGTSFDGFSESSLFTDIIGRPTGWSAVLPKSIGLLVMIGIVTVLYWFGAQATARVTGIDQEEAADMFAPSLIPIVWAYAVAHYAQLLVDQSQSFIHRLSNPYGRFDSEGVPTTDWFGTASNVVDLNVVDVDLIAWIQAMAIVVGHVLAVLYAHDLAVGRFTKRDATRSQQTMLLVMVLYSVAGLWLLFAA
jgi:hypothetical protein